jgi:hypothetical protein
MRRRDALLLLPPLGALSARQDAAASAERAGGMQSGGRNKTPAACPHCGWAHVTASPPACEHPLCVTLTPRNWHPGQSVHMRFAGLDAGIGTRASRAAPLPATRFHLYIVSGDLEFFRHAHMEVQPDGTCEFETTLPGRGFYRLLGGCRPAGEPFRPAVQTIFSAGAELASFGTPRLAAEPGPGAGENLSARLWTVPAAPLAGRETQLHFELTPAGGAEPDPAAQGHVLAASADLIEIIQIQPAVVGSGARFQFNAVFQRPGMYRVWPQFQRHGVVNTLRFTVAVKAL